MTAAGRVNPTRLLRTLRAVRRYAARPIPDAVLMDILEVASWTGSSKNAEPREPVVVEDRAALTALAGLALNGEHLRQAAVAVVRRWRLPEPEQAPVSRLHHQLDYGSAHRAGAAAREAGAQGREPRRLGRVA